jgi:signal transduction histidine kinase/CHASE3 domain sensor protein
MPLFFFNFYFIVDRQFCIPVRENAMRTDDASLPKVRIIYMVTTLFLVVLSVYIFTQVQHLIASFDSVNHTNHVTHCLQKISTAVAEAETNKRGFLLTGDTLLLQKRDEAFHTLKTEQHRLDSLLRGNAEQVHNLARLQTLVSDKVTSINDISLSGQIASTLGSLPMRANIREGVRTMDSVKRHIEKMTTVEQTLLQRRTQQYAELTWLTPQYIIALFLGTLAILWASYNRINTALNKAQHLKERFEAEKTFAQTILDASPDNIIVVDKDLRYLSANPAAKRILLQYTDSYIGKKTTDVFPTAESVKDMLKALTGEIVYHSDFYSPVTNSHYEIIYTPLRQGTSQSPHQSVHQSVHQSMHQRASQHAMQGEEIVGVIAQSRDITNALKTSKQLEQQNKELVQLNEELELFAQISSHDLQEPLRKIQMSISRIMEIASLTLSDKAKDHFNGVQEDAQSMQKLIQDLTTYSRTKSDHNKFETTDLNDIIDQVKTGLKDRIDEKNATVEATGLCKADIIPFQFRQLMHNLIGNALKFSAPNRPPHIRITSTIAKGNLLNNAKLLPDTTYCHITVSDNGIGFEEEYSEKIFEVFQRLHAKEKYQGTGMGLAIVKKIIQNHTGIITAKSTVNVGTTFEIYVPTH